MRDAARPRRGRALTRARVGSHLERALGLRDRVLRVPHHAAGGRVFGIAAHAVAASRVPLPRAVVVVAARRSPRAAAAAAATSVVVVAARQQRERERGRRPLARVVVRGADRRDARAGGAAAAGAAVAIEPDARTCAAVTSSW